MRKMMHEGYEVIYIEYINKIPHKVITARTDQEWGQQWFDFECIGNDRKDIQYYNSGGGGVKRNEIQAPHFVMGKFKAHYWMAEGCKFNGRSIAKNCKRINKPFSIRGYSGRSINPFKVSWECSYGFEYCKICDAYYGHDEGCRDHHTWSSDEGCFVYADGSRVD